MKFKLILLSTLLFSLTAYSQTTRIDWSLPIASGSADRGHAIEIDASGNTYVTGYFQGTTNFDPNGTANLTSNGSFDVFIAKYDSDGNYVWAHNIGGGSADEAFDIALDGSNNVYVTGYFQGSHVDFNPGGGSFLVSSNGEKDAFLLKLDTNGDFVWVFNVGSSTDDDQGNAMAIDASDNIYLVGKYAGSSVDFDPASGTSTTHSSAGLTDIFIAKYNSSMVHQWSKGIGSTQNDAAESVTLDNSSNVYVTGSFIGGVDFNPGSTAQNLTSASIGGSAFIAKYSSSGTYSSKMQIGGADLAELSGGSDIITDGTTNLYLTGAFLNTTNPIDFGSGNTLKSTSDTADIFVAKYTLALSYVDAFKVGGNSGTNIGIGIDLDASNNVYIIGIFTGTNIDFDPSGTSNMLSATRMQDAFIAKYSSSLAYIEAFNVGGYLNDYASEIKLDASGNMHTIGYYSSTGIDFDPSSTNTSTLAYSGVNDGFVIKYHATEQAVPLPVELTYFQGAFKNDANILTWQTATEKNNSHFDIEWSSNGMEFQKVGKIQGFGNSLEKLDYEFLHKNFSNELNYYRLKQVDFDGQYEYSSIILIKNNASEPVFANVFPNPTHGELSLDTNYDGIIEVINSTGQLVKTFNATNTNQFSINDLPNGIYFIKLNHLIKRIVKQ